MQIIKVMYKKEDFAGGDMGFYSGNLYAYYGLDEFEIGDKVLAPVGNDPQPKKALVVDVGIDPNTIEPRILKILKTITRYDEEDGST